MEAIVWGPQLVRAGVLFGIMESWIPVLFLYSQVSWIFLVIAFGLYIWSNNGSSVLAPRGSPLGRILAVWTMYCYYPISKEVLTYYYNTVWPTYVLDCVERWLVHGSLNYHTING